ncbi:glycosyltransferase [Mammaliicoccus vitulinus]|uniref:glycosyltransferase n=1 Tax=Mammaliicoccus vitulinus TaxID=71237 RepID=UPI001867393B|nr:glycosyltransferase [Mammaliicoccus vitulinus]
MKKEVYFLINSLDVDRGGLTKACIQQANLSADLGYETNILTFNYNGEYSELIGKVRQRYNVKNKVKIHNMYDYFRNEYSINKKDIAIDQLIRNTDILEKVVNKDAYRVYDDGIYRNYITYRNNGSVKGVDYFDDSRYRIKSEFFTPEGYSGKISYMDIITNKPRQMVFKNSKGMSYLSKWINHETGLANRIVLFKDNEIMKVLKNDKELKIYFIEQLILKNENPILVSDARNTDEIMANVKNIKAKKIIRLHSNHISAPFDHSSEVAPTVKYALDNLDKIDCLAVLTNQQKEDITRRFKYNEKVVCIPHGIDITAKTNIFGKPKVGNDIVVVSRLVSLKQVNHIIEAVALIVKEKPDLRIKIYGSGDQEKNIKALIKKKHLETNIILMGYANNINEVYENALFSIVTSKTEGFSLSILESMANGTPVIAYNFNYGPNEIIVNNEDGRIIEKNNVKVLSETILELSNNRDLVSHMSKNALKNIENKFSKKQIKNMWHLFLNEI